MEKENQSFVQNENSMRINIPIKNLEKFREALLYILGKVGGQPNVGKTVIWKLLYFIDFDFYEKYEEQLIGATYRKEEFGFAPVEFEEIVNQMVENGDIEIIKSKYYKKDQLRYISCRNSNLDCFSAKELNLINDVLNHHADKNANQISEYSHGDIPWMVTDDKGIINYESVFYRTPEYSVRAYKYE